MILYMIRHGETDFNRQRRIQGQSDIPLNAWGRELARRTGKGLEDVRFDLVVTSPLIRAKETAQLIVGEKSIPFIEEPRIQEIAFGEYEASPWAIIDQLILN